MSYQPVTPTSEQLAELETKHGDLLALSGDPKYSPYLMVFRRPKRQEIIGYKHHLKKDSTTANEELVKRIVVFPDKAELDRILDVFPLAPDFCVNDDSFQKFVGLASAADLK